MDATVSKDRPSGSQNMISGFCEWWTGEGEGEGRGEERGRGEGERGKGGGEENIHDSIGGEGQAGPGSESGTSGHQCLVFKEKGHQ